MDSHVARLEICFFCTGSTTLHNVLRLTIHAGNSSSFMSVEAFYFVELLVSQKLVVKIYEICAYKKYLDVYSCFSMWSIFIEFPITVSEREICRDDFQISVTSVWKLLAGSLPRLKLNGDWDHSSSIFRCTLSHFKLALIALHSIPL